MTINVNKAQQFTNKIKCSWKCTCSVLPIVGDHIYQSFKFVTGTTKTIELGTGSPAPVQVM